MLENRKEKELDYRRNIRTYELDIVVEIIRNEAPGGVKLLEIGGGAGWQAERLSEKGFSVTSIDVQECNYKKDQIFDVIEYDGKNIPFKDDSFDIIFSSNVLEHILHVEEFQDEIKRVLKPDGTVIHLLPSVSWRLLTLLTFYPYLIKKIISVIIFSDKTEPEKSTHANKPSSGNNKSNHIWHKFFRYFFPLKHGVRGNLISEFYLFSVTIWKKMFTKYDFNIKKVVREFKIQVQHPRLENKAG